MQGREDEVAGLRRGQGGGDRLQVPHLADEDDVGVLTQGGLQGEGEVGRVGADLALVDDALVVRVQELDRVLDREDVLLALAVDHVQHRGQRGRLAGAGRAGDEDEAARLAGELLQDGGQVELLEGLDLLRDVAEGGADRAALEEAVDAEAGHVGDRVGEVELGVVLEPLALVVVEDRVDDLARLLRGQRRDVLERHDPPADAHGGTEAGGQMHVGGAHLDHPGEHVGEIEIAHRGLLRQPGRKA